MPRGGSDAVSSKSLCPLRVLVLMSYMATSEAVLRLCRPGMQLIFEKNLRSWNSRDYAVGRFLTVPYPSNFCTSSLQQLRPKSLMSGLTLEWNLIPTSGKDTVILSKSPFLVRGHFLIALSPQNHMCRLCFSRRQLMSRKNEGCKTLILCCVCHTVTSLSIRCCMLVLCARGTICFMNYNLE